MSASAFIAAYLLHLIAAASPGPAVLMTARIGMTEGLRTGAFLAAGIGLGALFWALAALFGLAILFQIAPAVLWGFKLAGGLFLIWLAWSMWRHAKEPLVEPFENAMPRSWIKALRLGVFTQLSNPKAAVFFGAVFVGTVPPDAHFLAVALLLLAIFLNELLCNIIVARLFSFPATQRFYNRTKTAIDRSFGAILALLGVKIAAT